MNMVSFEASVGGYVVELPRQYDNSPIMAEDVLAIGARIGYLTGYIAGMLKAQYKERDNTVRPIGRITLSGEFTEEERKNIDTLLGLVKESMQSKAGLVEQFVELDGLTLKLYH